MTTRLSIIMPNYNHGNFLEARIHSIVSQMGPNDELIVVDDGSTDNSISIAEKFLKREPRFRFIKNPHNLGAERSANIAANAAQGKYLTWLATDDRLLPGFIDETMKVLTKNPDIGLCCSDCAMTFDGYPDKIPDKIYTTRLIETATKTLIFRPKDIVKIFRTTHFWIPGHTTIAKRELILKNGGYRENLRYLGDWFLVHSIALQAGAAYIPKELAAWRQEKKCRSNEQREDPSVAKQCQWNIFNTLKIEKNGNLHKLFRKSGLLDFYARQTLERLWKDPYHWSFILRLTKKYLLFRWKKYIWKSNRPYGF